MLPILQNQSSSKMSLKEITDLIGVRHDKACLKVLSMAEDPEFGTMSIMDIVYNDKGQTIQTYMLDKRQSVAVASRLNTALLMRVIDRWQELENKNNPMAIAATMNSAQLSVLMAETQAKEQAMQKLALAQPTVEFVDRYVKSTGNLGFRQVCKLLKAKEPAFRQFLEDNRIMYKLAGDWVPYASHIDAGRFYVTTGTGDNDHNFTSAKFTPKGVEWVAQLWSNK